MIGKQNRKQCLYKIFGQFCYNELYKYEQLIVK